MKEFKVTHVFTGGDLAVFYQVGEQVMYLDDDVDGDPASDGVYVNENGLRQFVRKDTMIELPKAVL